MRQFLLFMGQTFYAAGGWHDFVDSFVTADSAARFAIEKIDNQDEEQWFDWYHVVDSATGEVVASSAGQAYC